MKRGKFCILDNGGEPDGGNTCCCTNCSKRLHSIISKLGAGEYGLQHLPREWHQIIKEAIIVRKGEGSEFSTSDEQRIDMSLRISKYIISYCNSSLIQKV